MFFYFGIPIGLGTSLVASIGYFIGGIWVRIVNETWRQRLGSSILITLIVPGTGFFSTGL
jgi:hypothetical protein